MRKHFLPILLLAALVLSGCEGMGLNGGKPRTATVTVRIPELTATRTTVGDDLLSVRWQTGDCLGVYSKNALNYCFGLVPESAEQASATFSGTIDGAVLAAYYPYSTSAGADFSAAKLTMPEIRTAESGVLDGRYGFLVSTIAEGSPRKGYTMTMVQKSALLNFTVKPNTFLAGSSLQKLKIKVPQRELAGKFKLDLTDMNAPLTFTASSDSIVITLSDAPTLVAGTSVSVPFYLNPAIAEGDSLHLILNTSKGEVYINLKADKALVAGARLDIALDIDALVKAGKAEIPADLPIEVSAFTALSTPGIYDLSNMESITPVVAYTKIHDQYGVYTSSSEYAFRIMSFQAGYMVTLSAPRTSATGTMVTLKVSSVRLTEVPDASLQVRCVAVGTDRAWFIDEANKKGYVIAK